MKAVHVSRAKAFECLSLAECMSPEERAEMVRFARVWMSFQLRRPGVPTSGPAVVEGETGTSLLPSWPPSMLGVKPGRYE